MSADPAAPSEHGHGRLRFGEFAVDRAVQQLRRDGETVHVEPRAFRLLLYLIAHRDRLVTKHDLVEQVWGGAFVTDNAVDRAVARLRKTLGDDVKEPRYIETAPGLGYRFVAEVTDESALPAAAIDPTPKAVSAPRARA